MHTTTRRELCKDQRHYARPENVDEYDARTTGARNARRRVNRGT